jgi:16S rRNA (guanine966-N2)-methyltransferase
MLTITGGIWSGRKLKALESPELRPTSSRVKASLFSILESLVWKQTSAQPNFTAWRCLDLFAGVGGLGLEMLSRGAESCTFVEIERRHAKLLADNIATLGCGASVQVILADARKLSWERNGPFDLVLMDPPYKESALPEILSALGAGEALKPGGIVLFEHDPKLKPAEISGLTLQSHRVLGPAGITVYVRALP